jgi:undecaprenyl diphosphate synthase
MRHSGFFLFGSPYAEYYFSEKNWPDFDEEDLEQAIESFEGRERKF